MRMEESSRANPAGGTQNSTSLFVDCWPDRVQISFATLINLKYNGHSQRGKEATSRARLEHSQSGSSRPRRVLRMPITADLREALWGEV